MSHIRLNFYLQAHEPHRKHPRRQRVRLLRPIRPSRKNELWYKAELLKIVRLLRSNTRDDLLPVLRRFAPVGGDSALPSGVSQTFEAMARKFGGTPAVAQRLATLAARQNLHGVDDLLISAVRSSLGLNITPALTMDGPIREAVRKAVQANVELITSIPEQYFSRLRQEVVDNLEAGTRWEDFADALEHIGEITESRAKLIARDQTSKMNSSFNEARQTSVGIEEYTWQTSGDERVRESHADKDEKVFRWDSPPEDTGNPGEDIQCRCVAIPHIDLDAEEASLADGGTTEEGDDG